MPESLTLPRAIALFVLALAALALTGGCGPTLVKADYQMPRPLVHACQGARGAHPRPGAARLPPPGNPRRNRLGRGTRPRQPRRCGRTCSRPRSPKRASSAASRRRSPAAGDLQALAQPRIEQYSFATARETVGGHWASTLRLRLGVFSPTGQPVDSLTMNGYGNSYGNGGAKKSLGFATRSALRDASAKFLVQMPRQPIAARLAAGGVIDAPTAPHAHGRHHRSGADRSGADGTSDSLGQVPSPSESLRRLLPGTRSRCSRPQRHP